MQAYRNINGTVVTIEVDVDSNGNPLLPPDTTVDPEPTPIPGHYNTVVGNAWVQIPIPTTIVSFEYEKQLALEKLKKYKDWYLNQPVDVTVGTTVYTFDADETARNRLAQALVINSSTGYLPPSWIDANNNPVTIATVTDLTDIATGVQTAFSTKFFEVDTIRQNILAATDNMALSMVSIPEPPLNF